MQYLQRTLLCRVFTLQQQALQWQQHTTPTTFQRIYSTFSAWQLYTAQCREQRQQLVLQNKARCFRGATLLATHYYRWVDYTHHALKEKRQARIRLTIVLHSCFTTWVEYVQYLKYQVELLRQRVTVDAPRRRVLRAWRDIVKAHTITLPLQHYRHVRLRGRFDVLRTAKALRRMESAVLPLCARTRLRAR